MEATTQSVTTPTTDKVTHHQRGALDRDTFCPRLQRLLLGAASELGQRGNLAQVVSSIERGGVGGGGEDPNLGMLRRLGATDNRGIDNRVGQIRELEQRWRGLATKHQALALAHYLGTPRAHHTLQSSFGHGQGGLAGVVLYRWQFKQTKARDRGANASAVTVAAELERVRAELAPLDRGIAQAQATLDRPAPAAPEVGEEATRAERRALLAPWRAALQVAQDARRDAEWQRDTLLDQAEPLRAEQARLCAQQATLAAVGSACDDEQALVDLCRGKLEDATRQGMVDAAAADVRALHRAWYASLVIRTK